MVVTKQHLVTLNLLATKNHITYLRASSVAMFIYGLLFKPYFEIKFYIAAQLRGKLQIKIALRQSMTILHKRFDYLMLSQRGRKQIYSCPL
uniref:Uncharacterized protein n=1 Tax=Glossina palpalis gambiensis TaxID=67801 RepID=A0A1B0B8Y5_9MUSC